MAQQILIRRDTAAQWTTVNPTLAEGELGIETDTIKLKVGTGVLAWNALPYVSGGEGGTANHSLLLNLNADDHTQYHTDARGDQRYVGLSDARLTDARTPLAHEQAASTISGLATVATSGSYADLSNKPTIPTLPTQASSAELLAGTETAPRLNSPADLVTAIVAHAPAGATTLAALTDVDLTTPPTDTQALVYSTASSKWVPGDAGGSGGITTGKAIAMAMIFGG